MTINLGNFGNSIQAVTEQPTYKADMTIANALSSFGKMAGDMAIQEQRDLDETEAVKRTAEYEVGATELLTVGTEKLRAGEIKPDGFEGWYSGELTKLKSDKVKGVRQTLADRLSAGFDVANIKLGMKARDTQAGFVKEVQTANLMQTREQLERLALSDPEGAKRQWLTALNTVGTKILSAPEIAKDWQAFQEKVTFNKLASDLEGMTSIGSVGQLESQLANPEFQAGLSPEARLQLRNAAQSKKREMKAEADRVKREREYYANEQARQYVDILGSGLPVNSSLRTEMVEFANNSGKAGKAVRQTLANYDVIRQQQLKPLNVQGAELTTLRNQVISEKNADRRAELQDRYSVLSQSYVSGVNAFKQDPLNAYAARTNDPLPPLDISSTGNFLASLKGRSQYALRAQSMYGKPVDLMTNAEAESFVPEFRKMPVAAQADMLKAVRSAGGDRAALSLAGSLSKQDPVLGFAAYHAAKNAMTTAGRSTSQLILKGMKSQIKLPDATRKSIVSEAEKKFGTALAGNSAAFNTYVQSATMVYSALSEQAGDFNGDYDTDRAESAISIAMGTKPIEINGASVLPPVGRNPERFKGSMLGGIRGVGANVYGLKGDALDQFVESTTLRPSANDTYELVNSKSGGIFQYPAGGKYSGPIKLRGDK